MDYNKEAMEAARRARDGQRAYEEQLDKEARARAKKALAEWFTRVEIHDPPTAPSISDIKRDGKYRTVTFAWSYAGHNYSGSYREYRSLDDSGSWVVNASIDVGIQIASQDGPKWIRASHKLDIGQAYLTRRNF